MTNEKALEQEPFEDAISRQAVEEMIKAEMPERGMWEIEGDKEKETVCEVCVDLMQKLSELQPVTPKPKTDVLDKIRAEIENDWQLKVYPSSPFSCGLRRAIEIIDKYKVESEEGAEE